MSKPLGRLVASPYAVTAFSWALLTVALLIARSGLAWQWLPLGLLLVALTAVLRVRQPFGFSGSTKVLLQSARSARATATRLTHRLPLLRRHDQEARLLNVQAGIVGLLVAVAAATGLYYWNGSQLAHLLWLLLVPALGLLYAWSRGSLPLQALCLTALVILLALSPLAVMAAYLGVLVACKGFWLAWRRQAWVLLLPVSAGSVWLAARAWPQPVGMILLATAVYGASALLVCARRRANERESARTALVLTYGLAMVFMLQFAPEYSPLLILSALACAGLAWSQHGRASHAKYFLLLAVYLTLAIMAVSFSPGWLVLAGLVAAVGLLVAGFAFSSYTIRLGGLAALLGTVAVYAVEVLPVSDNSSMDPILNRIGLGLGLSVILPLLGDWYAGLPLDQAERRLARAVDSGGCAFAALLLCSAIFLGTTGWMQSLLWIVSGLLLGALAARKRQGLFTAASIALVVGGALKLVAIDAWGLPAPAKALSWLAAVILLAIYAWAMRFHTTHSTRNR